MNVYIAPGTIKPAEIQRELTAYSILIKSKMPGEEANIPDVMILDGIITAANITEEQIRSKTRKREIVRARQVYYYFMRNIHKGLSLEMIGKSFSADHATVLHGIKTVKNLLETGDIHTSTLKESVEHQLGISTISC